MPCGAPSGAIRSPSTPSVAKSRAFPHPATAVWTLLVTSPPHEPPAGAATVALSYRSFLNVYDRGPNDYTEPGYSDLANGWAIAFGNTSHLPDSEWDGNTVQHAIAIIGWKGSTNQYVYVDTCGNRCASTSNGGLHYISPSRLLAFVNDGDSSSDHGLIW